MVCLRKAAIVLTSLPRREAADVLSQLAEPELTAIVAELTRLARVRPDERRSAVEEFTDRVADHDRGFHVPSRSDRSGAKVADAPSMASRRPGVEGLREDSSLAFLRTSDPKSTAEELLHERPQAAALILAQLPRPTAMVILTHLPSETQLEIVRRMASLNEVASDVVIALARGLAERIQSQV